MSAQEQEPVQEPAVAYAWTDELAELTALDEQMTERARALAAAMRHTHHRPSGKSSGADVLASAAGGSELVQFGVDVKAQPAGLPSLPPEALARVEAILRLGRKPLDPETLARLRRQQQRELLIQTLDGRPPAPASAYGTKIAMRSTAGGWALMVPLGPGPELDEGSAAAFAEGVAGGPQQGEQQETEYGAPAEGPGQHETETSDQ